jgi:hypothetical protein
MQVRSVALIGALCVTTGWLLASMLTPPVARLQTLPQPRAAQSVPANPDSAFTERLELRRRQSPATPSGRRNPFTFGTRERVSPGRESGSLDAAAPPAAAPVATAPALSLAGVGITGGVFTAVLATPPATVHIVKVGDLVNDYTVEEITESSVTLRRDTEQLTLHLPH